MQNQSPLTLRPRTKATALGREAARALLFELALYPKPGLVSPIDNGAHDITVTTFARSILALRSYFVDIAEAGARAASFAELRRLGIVAENKMLAATGGIDTHRGVIFSLGFLTAAAGWWGAQGLAPDDAALAETILTLWGEDIAATGLAAPDSRGMRASRHDGACDELLGGLPTLFNAALPALRGALAQGVDSERASVQCLFAIMAHLEDTDLTHRGGPEGLAFVQNAARKFLDAGGVFAHDWRQSAVDLHGDCVARRLSPGGAADCFAAAWFVHGLNKRAEQPHASSAESSGSGTARSGFRRCRPRSGSNTASASRST